MFRNKILSNISKSLNQRRAFGSSLASKVTRALPVKDGSLKEVDPELHGYLHQEMAR